MPKPRALVNQPRISVKTSGDPNHRNKDYTLKHLFPLESWSEGKITTAQKKQSLKPNLDGLQVMCLKKRKP